MLCMMLVLSALPFVGCHKEPTVEPTKTIVIDWDWRHDPAAAPSMDTIKKYTKQADVKYVYINLVNKGPSGGGMICGSLTPKEFNFGANELEKRFKYSDKVKGSGTIIVSRLNGAQLPDVNSGLTGMALEDSIRFAKWGYTIEREK